MKGEWGLIKLTPSQVGFCALRDSTTPGQGRALLARGPLLYGHSQGLCKLLAQPPSLQGLLLASQGP